MVDREQLGLLIALNETLIGGGPALLHVLSSNRAIDFDGALILSIKYLLDLMKRWVPIRS